MLSLGQHTPCEATVGHPLQFFNIDIDMLLG
jgi:hypothetical protein